MENRNVPYIVHEGTMARFERTIKRLYILVIVAVALLFLSNALWLRAWTQYDYSAGEVTTQEVTQDGSGNNVFGNGNEVTNEPESTDPNSENTDTQEE